MRWDVEDRGWGRGAWALGVAVTMGLASPAEADPGAPSGSERRAAEAGGAAPIALALSTTAVGAGPLPSATPPVDPRPIRDLGAASRADKIGYVAVALEALERRIERMRSLRDAAREDFDMIRLRCVKEHLGTAEKVAEALKDPEAAVELRPSPPDGALDERVRSLEASVERARDLERRALRCAGADDVASGDTNVEVDADGEGGGGGSADGGGEGGGGAAAAAPGPTVPPVASNFL